MPRNRKGRRNETSPEPDSHETETHSNVVSDDLQERVGNQLRVNSTLAKTQKDLARVSSDLQQQVCDLSTKNSTLQEELEHTKNREKHLLEMNQQMLSGFRKKNAEMAELQNTFQTFEKKKLESEILLENEVSSLRININSLETKIESKEAECVALKKAYDKLVDDYRRLNGEHDEVKSQLESIHEAVRAEYEEMLKEMKAQMKSDCTQILEAKDEKHTKNMRKLQETSTPDSLERTKSHDQLRLQSQRLQSHSRLLMLEEETVGVSRRQSVRTVPSGIGKVFRSEDEAGEVFNNKGLADPKVSFVNDENSKPGTSSRFFSSIFSGRQRKNKTKAADRRKPGFFGISINK